MFDRKNKSPKSSTEHSLAIQSLAVGATLASLATLAACGNNDKAPAQTLTSSSAIPVSEQAPVSSAPDLSTGSISIPSSSEVAPSSVAAPSSSEVQSSTPEVAPTAGALDPALLDYAKFNADAIKANFEIKAADYPSKEAVAQAIFDRANAWASAGSTPSTFDALIAANVGLPGAEKFYETSADRYAAPIASALFGKDYASNPGVKLIAQRFTDSDATNQQLYGVTSTSESAEPYAQKMNFSGVEIGTAYGSENSTDTFAITASVLYSDNRDKNNVTKYVGPLPTEAETVYIVVKLVGADYQITDWTWK